MVIVKSRSQPIGDFNLLNFGHRSVIIIAFSVARTNRKTL